MIKTLEGGRGFFVEVNDPRLIQDELNAAEGAAIQKAMAEGRCGILVIRHGHAAFTVAVSVSVPYGQTVEVNARVGAEAQSTLDSGNSHGLETASL